MLDPVGIANWSVTHVDWSEGKWHPKSYKAQDVTYGLMKNITVRTMPKHLFHLPFVYSYYPSFSSQFSFLSFFNNYFVFGLWNYRMWSLLQRWCYMFILYCNNVHYLFEWRIFILTLSLSPFFLCVILLFTVQDNNFPNSIHSLFPCSRFQKVFMLQVMKRYRFYFINLCYIFLFKI